MSDPATNLIPKTRHSAGMDNRIDARVSVLEHIAAQTTHILERLESRMDRLESKMDAGFKESRSETAQTLERFESKMDAGFKELRAEMKEGRKIQERDFRITFSALIFLGIGFAGLLAHAMKWL